MARPGIRWSLRLVALALTVVLLYGAGTFVDVWLTSRREFTGGVVDGQTTAGVVLGAAQYNGEPSPVLRQRLDLAARLFEERRVDLVVVTGGGRAGDLTTEAKASYDYLRRIGIPDGQIRLEVDGTSTYESVAAAARFLRREGTTRVVLVTDRYHARRSLLVAGELGLDAEVALTEPDPSLGRLVHESVAVGIGRIITFRRLELLSD